jgi:hypothetical protein
MLSAVRPIACRGWSDEFDAVVNSMTINLTCESGPMSSTTYAASSPEELREKMSKPKGDEK